MTKQIISRYRRKSKIKIGDKFGRLEIIRDIGIRNGKPHFKCCCKCGKIKIVCGGNLKNGHTKSCGCLHKEITVKRNFVHGMRHTKTYETWAGMIQRCDNPKSESYPNYGDRSITVCKQWYKFENFLEDMQEKPDGLTIERIDNDKGYYKDNCCWASPSTQARNRRVGKNNKTGVSGVCWNKKSQKYQVSIGVNNKKLFLGLFTLLEHAKRARQEAEQEYWR